MRTLTEVFPIHFSWLDYNELGRSWADIQSISADHLKKMRSYSGKVIFYISIIERGLSEIISKKNLGGYTYNCFVLMSINLQLEFIRVTMEKEEELDLSLEKQVINNISARIEKIIDNNYSMYHEETHG